MTITLDQARKLHKLGVRKESDFYYCSYKGEQFNKYYKLQIIQNTFKYAFPAYNAEELIKLLRAKEHIQIDIYSHDDGFMFHQEGSWVAGEDDIHGSTLTEALANKLIFDLENGIVSIEEVNK